MVAEQYRIWRAEIAPSLAEAGIRLLRPTDLSPEQKTHLSGYFAREVWPVLTPLAVDPGHPFPMLRNRSLNLAILMHREREKVARRETMVAVVQVPSVLPRITEVPGAGRFSFTLLEDLIAMHAGELFPGFRVVGCNAFRVTRNFDLSIDEDEADDLLKTIQKELRRRERGSAVRLEIAQDTPPEVVGFLGSALRLEPDDVYLTDGPVHLADLAPICGARGPARAHATSRSRRRSCRPCRSTTTSSASSPSGTCCCTTPTNRSRTWSSSSRRRPTIPTCWPSSRRCTGPAPTRRSSAR